MTGALELAGVEDSEKLNGAVKLKRRRDMYVHEVMSLVAPVVKSWYLKTSVDFLKERQLGETDEDLFADFTEFCTENLDSMSRRALRIKNRNLFVESQV